MVTRSRLQTRQILKARWRMPCCQPQLNQTPAAALRRHNELPFAVHRRLLVRCRDAQATPQLSRNRQGQYDLVAGMARGFGYRKHDCGRTVLLHPGSRHGVVHRNTHWLVNDPNATSAEPTHSGQITVAHAYQCFRTSTPADGQLHDGIADRHSQQSG